MLTIYLPNIQHIGFREIKKYLTELSTQDCDFCDTEWEIKFDNDSSCAYMQGCSNAGMYSDTKYISVINQMILENNWRIL